MTITADLTRFMDNARVRLPGAIDAAIKLELFYVMKRFLQETNLWKQDIEFDVTQGVTEYTLTPIGICAIDRLHGVVNSDDTAVAATMREPGELILNSEPQEDDTYTATVSVTVAEPATRDEYPEYPDWVLTKYDTVLLDGLLGSMMSQIAKPYSNERMAIYHGRAFRTGISKARVEGQRMNLHGAQSWSFPRNFVSRSAR